MWFTSALAVSQILIGLLLVARCHRTITYIIYGILLTVVANYLTGSGCDINYYYFRSGMIATLFLAIGGLYFRYENKITDILQNRKFAIINILFFVLYCFLTINTDGVKSSVNSGSVNFLGVLSATYISINIIWLVKKMPDIPLLSYIGKNSILFYFFSGAIPNVIAIIASRFLGLTGANCLFATFVLSIIIAYIVVYIIVSYFPWLVDIRKLKSDRI